MSLELHHHNCPSCHHDYACVDPECANRDGKEECCMSCYYGNDKLLAVTIKVLRYKELFV